MVISFKDVGYKQYDVRRVETTEKSLIPIGIKTPLEFGQNGNLYEMNYQVSDQIHDNLKNLLLTNHGERLGRYFFGANLRELAVEFTTKGDFDEEAVVRINTAVSDWLPFVELIDFSSSVFYDDDKTIAKIGIVVVYSVPQINVIKRQLEIILYVI